MTTTDPSAPAATPAPNSVSDAAGEPPVRIPDWMREPRTEHPPTGSERLRLVWEEHGGKVLGGIGGIVALGLVVVLAVSGMTFRQRVHDGEPLLPRRDRTAAARPTDASGNSLGVYVGTPAESFAAGADAIELPAATAAGPFTAKQVANALDQVRQALVAARLAPSMVAADEPGPFLALLAEDNRDEVRADLADGASLNYATRIDPDANPGWVRDDGVRAKGTVSFRATTDADGFRVVEITTSFLWVYSFDLWQAQKYPPGTELVTIRDRVVWHLPHPDDVLPASRGLWVAEAASTVQNADCAAIRRGYLALEKKDRLGIPTPGPTGDVYQPDWRPGDGEEC
ncbi:hypothetical protein [Micromonospora sp. WMMD812]|uniref:hypothetical protein n=1 Tax=Micromonospora sp. WMMD812 TaxID=3015152 RepID=UPI00248BBF6E|nr:hypothetical protein [Micromonospora sp. WMMD812]WBB70366.1 hypothetical protein O7603_13830 [Micromonospora sp. WMMD812]